MYIRYSLSEKLAIGDKLTCVCGREYAYGIRGGGRKGCNTCLIRWHRHAFKLRCIRYKGGKCQRCGYARCLAALSFHHRDRTQKSFTISRTRWGWKKVKAEIDKCDLLCANCHMEQEWKELEHTLIAGASHAASRFASLAVPNAFEE